MGDADGATVGSEVGADVGFGEGFRVGFDVGFRVGDCVGFGEGSRVGDGVDSFDILLGWNDINESGIKKSVKSIQTVAILINRSILRKKTNSPLLFFRKRFPVRVPPSQF